ncbi:hypothetical protein DFH27DRAFT_604680 [Peziza echinospora]|nr:hypothetical protein DFH27DRAFT_604680 [Peziza echinospora]
MGPTWEMIAHERHESCGDRGKLQDALPKQEPFQIICRLAVPVAASRNPPEDRLSFLFRTANDGPVNSSRDTKATPGSIPAAKPLTRILRPKVFARFYDSLAPWANTPLIHASCAMSSNPPGIITKVPPELPEELEVNWPPYKMRPADMDVYTLMKVTDPIVVSRSLRAPGHYFKMKIGYNSRDCCYEGIFHQFRGPNILTLKRYFPVGHGWALRNLTKKLYVYAAVLSSDNGLGDGGEDRPHARHEERFSLGSLVSVMTCWSDENPGVPYGVKYQGDWAGDCFDIVEQEKLNAAAAAGESWVDWSLEAWKLMMRIWEGNNWYGISL